MRRRVLAPSLVLVGLLTAPAALRAEDAPAKPPPLAAETFETANLEDPVFPGPRVVDALRVRVASLFLPGATFDSFDADLYRPDLRLRATAPLWKRGAVQLTARFGTSLYQLDGEDGVLTSYASGGVDDFYATALDLQMGMRVNDGASLFVKDEIWSVLAAGAVRSSWESGAFDEGLVGGGGLALGYEIVDVFRIALGVELGSRIDRGGVGVGPIATFRWNVTDRFTLRSRGIGLQLEYALTPRLEVFATGFRESDTFRLERRPGLPDDLTFRDEAILAGVGLEWRISKQLRVNVEGGAVPWRKLRVKSHDRGELSEENADPGPYFEVRLEMRP